MTAWSSGLGSKPTHGVKLEFYGPGNSVTMKCDNPDTGQKWLAVLMPMRD